MIAPHVLTEADVHTALSDRGFKPTDVRTNTGRFWVHASSEQHIQVPDSLEGYYPDWMLWDLMARIGEIIPSSESRPNVFISYSNSRRH